MDRVGVLDDIDYMIIDYMNNGIDRVKELCSKLGISRATLFRRIERIRENGFRRVYDICLDCLELGIAYVFLEGEGVYGLSSQSISIEGFTIDPLSIYLSFSPYRRIVLEYLIPLNHIDQFNDRIYELFSEKIVSDIFILEQVLIPYYVYSSGECRIPGINTITSYRRESDIYDYILAHAFLKGYTRLAEISRDYIIPSTTLEYHFREHVRKAIRGRYWVRWGSVNALIEIVLDNDNSPQGIVNDLYVMGSVSSMRRIMCKVFRKIQMLFIECHVLDFSQLIKYFHELYVMNKVLDIRLFPVHSIW